MQAWCKSSLHNLFWNLIYDYPLALLALYHLVICKHSKETNLVMPVDANRKNTQIGFKSCNDISRPKAGEDGCSTKYCIVAIVRNQPFQIDSTKERFQKIRQCLLTMRTPRVTIVVVLLRAYLLLHRDFCCLTVLNEKASIFLQFQ